MKKNNIEWHIFTPALLISTSFIVAMLLFPSQTKTYVNLAFHYMTHDLGWMYLITILALLCVSLWIAFSKYGSIKLGNPEDKKAYSDWTWTAMLFAAGMSIAVVLLGFIEPINLLSTPPMGLEPLSLEAYPYAHMYAQFFEGPIAWGVYGPASAAVAYTIYVKKDDVLRVSNACAPVLGKQARGFWGYTIDVLIMLGMIGGVSTSLGMGTPTVTAMIEHLTGIPESFTMTICVMVIWAALFGTSVYLGLDKGIRVLSDINLYILFILLGVVVVSAPITNFIYLQLNSLGLMIDHFGELTLGSSPFAGTTFTQDWTIFYWAWWLAFMPIISLFGARISKGRTMRQMILGELVYGGGGSLFVFGLLGSYSLHLQASGTLDLVTLLSTQGRERTLIAILETLPMPTIMLVMVLCLIFVFLATTIDTTAYTLASVCTTHLTGDEQPERWNRMLWAGILLLFSLGLVFVGGLQTAQTASILLGFPLIFVSIVVVLSLLKMFKNHTFR